LLPGDFAMLHDESVARRRYNMSVRIASAHNVLNLKKPFTVTVHTYFDSKSSISMDPMTGPRRTRCNQLRKMSKIRLHYSTHPSQPKQSRRASA